MAITASDHAREASAQRRHAERERARADEEHAATLERRADALERATSGDDPRANEARGATAAGALVGTLVGRRVPQAALARRFAVVVSTVRGLPARRHAAARRTAGPLNAQARTCEQTTGRTLPSATWYGHSPSAATRRASPTASSNTAGGRAAAASPR